MYIERTKMKKFEQKLQCNDGDHIGRIYSTFLNRKTRSGLLIDNTGQDRDWQIDCRKGA